MKIIVFDDDPTGSQTVYGCPLLLSWDKKILESINSMSEDILKYKGYPIGKSIREDGCEAIINDIFKF